MVLSVEARVRIVLRGPSRRYTFPKAVLAGRLEIGWLNVFRVKAALLALKGYDPHVENWDQSPFHHNETGSNNTKTLAVAGVEVPLVELHTATRMRWTANLTTFSDHARLKEHAPLPLLLRGTHVQGGRRDRLAATTETHPQSRIPAVG